MEAAGRRAERDAQRRQRELQRMKERDQAVYDVEVYENYIELLQSVHKECSEPWDWEALYSGEPPEQPNPTEVHEEIAAAKFQQYTPNLFDKLLGRVDSKYATLTRAVEQAREKDQSEHRTALSAYEEDYTDWQETKEVSSKILAGEENAYLEAIEETNPFSDISSLGSSLSFRILDKATVEAEFHVNDEKVVPKEVKSLLRSGKVSVKAMPKGAFYELYQDYMCCLALRVARELFALLPVRMVMVIAIGNLLNTQTGYMEDEPVLSIVIPKETLDRLHVETIDPSDSMKNFVHNMNFKKTSGFHPVERIDPAAFQFVSIDSVNPVSNADVHY